jgi:hypothetical protein
MTISISGSGTLSGQAAPAFSAKHAGGTTLPSATNTKIVYGIVEFDTAGVYNSTLGRWTPNVAGYYFLHAGVRYGNVTNAHQGELAIYKNGTIFKDQNMPQTGSNDSGVHISCTVYLNGTTDYVEVWANQNGTATGTTSNSDNFGGPGTTGHWSGFLVRYV